MYRIFVADKLAPEGIAALEQYPELEIDFVPGLSVEDAIPHAREADAIMPGFTHMQAAQPVTCGHHLMAWFEMLDRDAGRFRDCRRRLNVSPLGAAALAGPSARRAPSTARRLCPPRWRSRRPTRTR